MNEQNISDTAAALAGQDASATATPTSAIDAITSADVIKAATILRKYKDGKSALESRLKEDE